jgi:cysteine synthase
MKEKKYMNQQKHKRIIISGGGTGGHIFPAISIANALRKIDPETEILFVGAEGKNGNGKNSCCRLQDNRITGCRFIQKPHF